MKRTDPKIRKEQIIDAAIILAVKIGYRNLTRDAVAKKAGVSSALVTRYFPMGKLKTAVMQKAINNEVIEVIAQGLAYRDRMAVKIAEQVIDKVVAYMTK